MSDTKQMLFARDLMCICIDGVENADYQGKIWHQYSDEPIEFGSCVTMLRTMDNLMDEWDFPQRGLEGRDFDKKSEKVGHKGAGDELVIDKIQQEHGTRNVQNKRGSIATFVVQIAFRQRATWQGHVVCAESNEMKEFESAMALLRIMDRQIGGAGQ